MYKGRLLDIVPIAHELINENVKNGILIVDDHLRMIDFNPAAAKLLSLDHTKNVGAPIQSMESFWGKIENHFDRYLTKRIEISAQSSSKKYLDVYISPLHDHRKRFLGWAVIMDDISTHKQAEKELQTVNRRLKQQLGEIQDLQDKLHEQAMRDPITGVYNRRFLEETLSREISHAQRKGHPLSIIMLDIDFFKKVNDSFGHKIGDDVLISLSKLLQTETRDSDCVSRYGGDEFVLVMPEMTKEDAFQRAEHWRKAIKSKKKLIGEYRISITVSLGISTFPANGSNSEELFKAADEALYQAKATGRDRTCKAI
jgi:diguanylate cyclase (GGDEF)-like protein/PAS domain S-box-containing protein